MFIAAALSTMLLAGQPATCYADDTVSATTECSPPTEETTIGDFEQLPPLTLTLAALPELNMMEDGDAMAGGHSYYISKVVDMNYDDTVVKLKELLTAEKFAVLTEIDLQAKFKEKLQVDIPRYTIFGACGAKWAHAIWAKEFHIGALMPCNVVVAENADGKIEVFFKDPSQLPMATGNAGIAETVATVKASVDRIMEAL
jgi:uncharacterized protein (DUF302 family)